MALADIQQLVDSMVRDQSGTITPLDRDRAINIALARYSVDCERILTEDVTWLDEGHLGPMPAQWADGAWLVDAEYPIGEQPRQQIELAVYMVPPATMKLTTTGDSLPAGATVRVRFAAPHLLAGGQAGQDTVPARHREAFASYAAFVLCRQLATHFSGDREASVGADASSTESRSRNYAQRAKEYRAGYFSGVGRADPEAAKGGSAAVSGGEGAASVGSWAGRQRAGLVRMGDAG